MIAKLNISIQYRLFCNKIRSHCERFLWSVWIMIKNHIIDLVGKMYYVMEIKYKQIYCVLSFYVRRWWLTKFKFQYVYIAVSGQNVPRHKVHGHRITDFGNIHVGHKSDILFGNSDWDSKITSICHLLDSNKITYWTQYINRLFDFLNLQSCVRGSVRRT